MNEDDRVHGSSTGAAPGLSRMGFTELSLGDKADLDAVVLTSQIIDYRKRPLPSELKDYPYQEPKDSPPVRSSRFHR